MAIILPANTLSAGGYTVANSCRFNDGDSAYMHKALGTPTSTKIGTLSTWFKRAQLNQEMNLLGAETDSNDRGYIQLDDGTNGIIRCWAEASSSAVFDLRTNRLFRDVSAWYHIVVAYDTSQATAANRVKIYINGIQETSFSTETYPSQDVTTMPWNISGYNTSVGAQKGGAGTYGTFFDGYQAETVFIDGQQLAPTSFGEFDEDSPTIWKPIDVSGLTFGNNGFYLDYEDSANLGNDANGGTDLTEVNLAATDQATDTPTNNFATWNSVMPALSNTSFSEGNLTFASNGSASGQLAAISTMAASTGKWYAEFKMTDESTQAGSYPYIGTVGTSLFASTYIGASGLDGVGFNSNLAVYSNGSEIDSSEANIAAGNIVGVAADFTNKKIYFHVNGTYINSGDPAAGSNGYTIPTTAESFYSFMCSVYGASGTWEANFGSPSFSITSGNADANGYGNFEYAVPSGYFAMNSKNLGAYGG